MQSEPKPFVFTATPEEREGFIARFEAEYGYTWADLCACGSLIGKFTEGVRVRSFTSPEGWRPQRHHSKEHCYVDETDLQAECQGPTRKLTGVYIGCETCEPYVRLAETRDSAYLYGVQFNDFEYEVYDGDQLLSGVLEAKVGVGGYIIQVRQTPDTHFCPCYMAAPDEDVTAEVCRAYIPGNDFRVQEVTEGS